jgi:hypothetical protein
VAKPLHKHTIVIWADWDGTNSELSYLAREAEQGDAYCSLFSSELIAEPDKDPAWDGTEFFDEDAEALGSETA